MKESNQKKIFFFLNMKLKIIINLTIIARCKKQIQEEKTD